MSETARLPSWLNDSFRKVNTLLERTTLFHRHRWAFLAFFYSYILYRIFTLDYLGLLYFIGLSVIYLIVQYYTPSGLPDPDEDNEENMRFMQESRSILVGGEGDRPVLRALGEFALWKNMLLVGLVALACTWFDMFLVPVYWPFLLIYFLWLIGLAVAKHWKHMKKYGYSLSVFSQRKKGTGVMI